MQIQKGSDRVVLIFPSQGFVVKIAIIRIFRATHLFFQEILKRNWDALMMRLVHPMRMPHSIRGMVLRGVLANWNEFFLYCKTRDPFLQPTYFSFFGLFNIEKYGKPCDKQTDPWYQLEKIIGVRGLEMDMHHLANQKNFTIVQGKLKIMDYGSKETRAVIKKFSAKINKEFKVE